MQQENNNPSSFPRDFLWGVATSAYQVEGGNSNSDWWEWEKAGRAKDHSGRACDYWNRWREDHKLLTELGVNSFRLSLEWSRVEPEEGKFSDEAIEHYREILQDLKNRNIKTCVTLWHWTSPIWFQKNYGFHKKSSVEIFTRYCEKIANELGSFIDIYVVLNEPMVPLGQGFLTGLFPPGFKNPWKFWRALNNLSQAYINSYQAIHRINPKAGVGISTLYNWFEADKSVWSLIGKIVTKIARWFRVSFLCQKIKGHMDYFGMSYYRIGKLRFDLRHSLYLGFAIDVDKHNAMEWVIYPEGILNVLREIKKDYNLPVYILENGMPTEAGLNDEARVKFIQDHIHFISEALSEGIKVRGYFQWSLFDNLEWLYGYKPRFGLVEIDYKTLERKPRKSYYAYRDIIKNSR